MLYTLYRIELSVPQREGQSEKYSKCWLFICILSCTCLVSDHTEDDMVISKAYELRAITFCHIHQALDSAIILSEYTRQALATLNVY